MLTSHARAQLEKQGYRLVGKSAHSAVKVCGWTRSMVRGRGGCYKLKFYGIMSHQCLQMTTSMSCANRCVFCWRGYKAPVSKEWKWGVDAPEEILQESLAAQQQLLVGFKGDDKASKALYDQSRMVKHVALSLTGEPIIYPRINELIREFNAQGISTFLVTNAQYPDQIQNLAPVTQLYLSLDAPSRTLLKKVDVPLFSDYWERLLASLDHLARKRQRTCIRLTAVKGLNMTDPAGYAALVLRADPDFIEIKAYMHIGESRHRLTREAMPEHGEVVAFSRDVLAHLPGYALVAEHIPSRVVMLAKKEYYRNGSWWTWIDFAKYRQLAQAGDDFTSEDYLKKTPSACVGISGHDSLREMRSHAKGAASARSRSPTDPNEDRDEMTLDKDA